ncbi:MAG TPA: MFS transporter [Puia sp.]|nr:MFS transporter [Puia sp.]
MADSTTNPTSPTTGPTAITPAPGADASSATTVQTAAAPQKERTFNPYQVFIISIIAIIQFTVILDFMVLSPLGAILMPALHISPSHFGLVVSAYAFSAGAAGLLTAGFADKFDRKKLLLFFYVGFILGTFLCAIAPDYPFLLAARIVTGVFGGVIGSISLAIVTDLFRLEVRGRVMGFVQMAFAASQVLGLPLGLVLANRFGWHSPFFMVGSFGALVGVVIVIYMRPITEHLKLKSDRNAFVHLYKTVSQVPYLKAFLATTLLATGGFMLMPFGSAFSIHNLGLKIEQLPLLYGLTGIAAVVMGPLTGKLSDKIGKYNMFCIGTFISIVMVAIYTNLGVTPFWVLVVINIILFTGIMARMISASALMTAIPVPAERGAFMSVNSSVQQFSGGIASMVAGLIVLEGYGGTLLHYNTLGYVVIAAMLICVYLLYFINKSIVQKQHKAQP